MKEISKVVSILLVSSVLSTVSYASNSLESNLLSSLELKLNEYGDVERKGDYGKAIRGYANAGYINKTPEVYRADYVDYYFLQKPASFLGHELRVIEEEYLSEYIGCCVNEGVGVVLKLSGSMQKLESFSQKNKCSIEPIDYYSYIDDYGIAYVTRESGIFVNMSCRVNDIEGF